MSIRQHALDALSICHPRDKVAAVQTLWANQDHLSLSPSEVLNPSASLPGRPERPRLLPPKDVPTRTPFTPEGLAALIHAVCHIEFNAINLGLDAVWRFEGMPEAFYQDWLRVAHEEAYHFSILHDLLNELGYQYGDFDAHDGLWHMCKKTADDVLARMALVPRTLEARGLDATPLIQTKLRKAATPGALKAVQLLDIILRTKWAMWRLATTGTAGCASNASSTPCRCMANWCNATKPPNFARLSTKKLANERASQRLS